MKNKTILIVDDTPVNIGILNAILAEYETIGATSGKDAMEIIIEEKIDLILLDIMMPDIDGYEVCRKLKINSKTKDIPVIFITAKEDEDSIEKAFDVGGIDYITKPFKPKEVSARVKNHLKMQDIQNELKTLSSTDPMTKLYNRRYFTEISEKILKLSKREKNYLSIIILDIDNFKNINDIYGHSVGDKVIISLANKLSELQRTSDIICRYGGEEFIILLPSTNQENAKIVAEKIRKSVESLIITLSFDKNITFTISLGVSHIDLENEDNIEEGLKRADRALYKAKESGKNRVCEA
jgi:diguanylate cyclase (GGDEF)-like protein